MLTNLASRIDAIFRLFQASTKGTKSARLPLSLLSRAPRLLLAGIKHKAIVLYGQTSF